MLGYVVLYTFPFKANMFLGVGFAVTRERVTDFYYKVRRSTGFLGFYSLLRESGSLTPRSPHLARGGVVSIRCYARAGH